VEISAKTSRFRAGVHKRLIDRQSFILWFFVVDLPLFHHSLLFILPSLGQIAE
jgi:hypothetical protein